MESRIPLADGTFIVYTQGEQRVWSEGSCVYNPKWLYTDKQGHVHRNQAGDFPTLEAGWVTLPYEQAARMLNEGSIDSIRHRSIGVGTNTEVHYNQLLTSEEEAQAVIDQIGIKTRDGW